MGSEEAPEEEAVENSVLHLGSDESIIRIDPGTDNPMTDSCPAITVLTIWEKLKEGRYPIQTVEDINGYFYQTMIHRLNEEIQEIQVMEII